MSCCVLSTFYWSGSWFPCQGARGHLQREKQVDISNRYWVTWFHIKCINQTLRSYALYSCWSLIKLLKCFSHTQAQEPQTVNEKWSCYFSQQWPPVQSQCREWKRIPDHVLSFCSIQSRATPPLTSFGPQTLGPGMFPAENLACCSH